MALQRRESSQDFVKAQGKLVVQVMKERVSAREWNKNWGFLKDKNKFLEEEANCLGWSPEQYWSAVKEVEMVKTQRMPTETHLTTTENLPSTSSGLIGWGKPYLLEKDYSKSNLKYKAPKYQNTIFLG